MTHERALQIIDYLVSSDLAVDAKAEMMRPESEKNEQIVKLGELLSNIYTLTHPLVSKCGNKHEDWLEKWDKFEIIGV